MLAWELQHRGSKDPPDNFSLTLIAAVSEDRVIASQFVEGGVDAVVYENFVYSLLQAVQADPLTRAKKVVLLMDNARIHHGDPVIATALGLGAMLLYSAEYSPWLNPVEWFFRHVKQQLRAHDVVTR